MPLFVSATVRQAAPRTRLPQEFRTQNLICDEPSHPLPIRMVRAIANDTVTAG
ncbi:MAG: hypothetical protein Q7W51_02625 [Coriobacteriia bacterium]|nr:hypothetical protein [Coriobacteriia bacterium]